MERGNRGFVFVLTTAALTALVDLCLPGPAAAGGAKPAFVFCRWQQGTYIMTEDGVHMLCFSHGDYVWPRPVPGRDAVVLNSMRGGRMGVWLYTLDGRGRRLCDGRDVAVSSDGRWIAYERGGVIYVRDLESSAERRASPAGIKKCGLPAVAADGRVAFVAPSAGSRRTLYICRPGQTAQRLAEGEILSSPAFSPDGQQIAFQNGAHIYLIDLASSSVSRLTTAAGVQSWPVFSADGKRVAYVASPSPFDGPNHVYIVPVKAPTKAMLAVRDVMPGPGWTGTGFTEGFNVDLPPADVSLWLATGPKASSDLAHIGGPGWEKSRLPATGLAGPFAVRTSWGALMISPKTGDVVMLTGSENLAERLTIRIGGPPGTPAQSFTNITVTAPSPGPVNVTLTARYGGRKTKVTLALSRTHPFITIAGSARVSIAGKFAATILPDRLAADLVVTPDETREGPVQLPTAPMLLALAEGGSALVTVLMPSPDQRAELAATDGAFSSINVDPRNKLMAVGLVQQKEAWRRADLRKSSDVWQIRWRNSCPGVWRAAIDSRQQAFAFSVHEDSPRREKWRGFDELAAVNFKPERAFIYLYGRTANTDPRLLTPLDLAWDCLGIDGTCSALDIRGIREYRHAREYVPYKHPRVCLRILGWIYTLERPGAKKKAQDVYRDIKLTLQGLDDRLAEYQDFAARLGRVDARSEGDKKFMAWLAQQIAKARTAAAENKAPSQKQMDDAFAKYMENTDHIGPLEDTVDKALGARLAALQAYRSLAQRVRVAAGKAFLAGQISPELAEQLRTMSWRVLRLRYYLEDDWRGEQPIGGPEVPYEKVMSL